MRFTLKRSLTWCAGGLFLFMIAGYAYYQSRALLEGPQILLDTPANGITTENSLISVGGITRHAKEIALDDRPIFIDLEGRFEEKLLLSPGYNIIVLTARDGEGRETRVTREIVYEDTRTDNENENRNASSTIE